MVKNKVNILVVGAGAVGLTLAAKLLKTKAVHVTLLENNIKRFSLLQQGNYIIDEPGMNEIFKKRLKQKRFIIKQQLQNNTFNCIFICIGTPRKKKSSDSEINFISLISELSDKVEKAKHNIFKGSYDKAKEELENLLINSVKEQSISDVPFGAFLSGGIDSSLVVAMLSEISPGKLETFSVGFEHSEYDESAYALEVSRMYKTKHTEIILRDSEILEGFIDGFNYFDEPFADSSWLATFLLSRVTANSVTVALSGDGGDEAFGGYIRYSILKKFAQLELVDFSQ